MAATAVIVLGPGGSTPPWAWAAGGVAVVLAGAALRAGGKAPFRAAMVLALLDAPFWVPGLELAAQDEQGAERPLRTATLPRVIARSLTTRIS